MDGWVGLSGGNGGRGEGRGALVCGWVWGEREVERGREREEGRQGREGGRREREGEREEGSVCVWIVLARAHENVCSCG